MALIGIFQLIDVALMKLLPIFIFSLVALSSQQPPGVPPRQPPGVPPQQPPGVPPQQPPDVPPQQTPHHQSPQQELPHKEHGHRAQSLEFASEVHNIDHVLEHLEKVVATKSKDQMTPEELEFHYFKTHDYDGNNKLDGVEIVKALTHIHPENNATDTSSSLHVVAEDELIVTVDNILNTFDPNKDGYIEYFEFKRMSRAQTATPQAKG